MITKQRVIAFGVMLSLTVALTGSSDAQTLIEDSGFLPAASGSFDVNPIPQFDPTLSNLGNTVTSTVTISATDVAFVDNGGDISNVFFTIEGLTHSHLGDLTVTVEHLQSNRIATLFERVGVTDTSGNGFIDNQDVDGDGDSSNLSGSYRFQDGGDSLFAVANSLGDGAVVPTLNSGGVGLPFYSASGAANGAVGLLNAFGTDGAGNALQLSDIVGDYVFSISDRSSLTTDTPVAPAGIQSFTATNVAFQASPPTPAIPEPASASGMLLALLGLAARRRRV